MSIKVSVIVPVYNAAPYLDVLINSIASQTLRNIEIIVVDDKSTDNSLALIKAHVARDSRIRLVEHTINSGPSVSRNTGIAHAQGDYIAFADSDDFLLPDALSQWFMFARTHDLDLVIGNAFRFTIDPYEGSISPLLSKQRWQEVKTGDQWIEDAVAQKEWPHYAWLQLVRLDLIQKAGLSFVKDIIHEDIIWTMQVALASSRVSFYREPLYGYRKTPDSILNQTSDRAKLRRCQSYLDVIETIGQQASEYPGNPKLRKALFRQCNQESGHLLGTVRKKITNETYKADIARAFFQRNLHRTVLAGISNISELWRAARCLYTLSKLKSKVLQRTDKQTSVSSIHIK